MWNSASRKEASSLVSSKHIKSIGAFLQTSLNWVILFFMLLILRYPMMGLLVYNFLKFISSSTSRLWLVFLALLLVWLATLSRCFLKFALKKYVLFTMGWKNIYYCVKNCLEIFGNRDRMTPMIVFLDAVALLHIITSEYPQSNFYRVAEHLYCSNVILYRLDDYCLFSIFNHVD